jgi:DNA-binding transcriptional ArsR family regulator
MNLTQTETEQIKVQIEANGMRYETSGSPQEVIPQILQFLSKVVPTYNLARKLIYVSDLAGLADEISEFAKMTTTGELLLTRNDLSADRAISVVLFMSHLAGKMGKRETESLSIEEIATAVGKAPKTIRNVIVATQKLGLIERAERGRYRVTPKGLMELEKSFLNGLQKGGTPE